MTNEERMKDLLSRFTPEEIERTKKSVEESDRKCEQALALLPIPKEVEQTIDKYMEQMRAEVVKQGGEFAAIVVPMYRHLMRAGAVIALAIGDEASNLNNKTWHKWSDRSPNKEDSIFAVMVNYIHGSPGYRNIVFGRTVPSIVEEGYKESLDKIYWIELPHCDMGVDKADTLKSIGFSEEEIKNILNK